MLDSIYPQQQPRASTTLKTANIRQQRNYHLKTTYNTKSTDRVNQDLTAHSLAYTYIWQNPLLKVVIVKRQMIGLCMHLRSATGTTLHAFNLLRHFCRKLLSPCTA
eukprot:GHRR01020694.1.p2 GENE.GHRR01020694.1~~GHRR01020694.1.p2  ORF type:complete len:106 (-),score=25.68 GHRR01020694.1:578-895(-)